MEDIQILSADEVGSALDKTRVVDALETAFAGLATQRSVQPTQTVTEFPDGRGDCIFYPSALLDQGHIGVKVSPYLQDIADQGGYPVTAYTLVLSARDGKPVLLCDSYALTTVRTAATTALAVRYLAPSNSTRLAIIGSGKVAREHLAFVVQNHQWDSISIYSPTASSSDERQAEVTAVVSPLEVQFSDSAQDAIRDADVILLCTSSATPVIEYTWIKPSALVCSISTNAANAHEIDPHSLNLYDVYCDYRATAPSTAGEMKLAIAAGTWNQTDVVADLAELASGAPARRSDKPAFFRSTGLGIEDLAIAGLLLS